MAAFLRVSFWKAAALYIGFSVLVIFLRYILVFFGAPDALVILIEELVKAGAVLALWGRSDCLPLLAASAFGFAEMGAIKPLILMSAASGKQAATLADVIFVDIVYFNAVLMHIITALVLASMRNRILACIAIIPNLIFHFFFNISRVLYEPAPWAICGETAIFALLIFWGMHRYQLKCAPHIAPAGGNFEG